MKEWYMMRKPVMTGSGFENENLNLYKDDLLDEYLDSELATVVTLYNYDLSESKKIRAIIAGNTADTSLKAMEREIITTIGTLHAGDYVYYENTYWLVHGRPSNNHVYEKAILVLCQLKLKWQKDDGTIVERWANFTSASKYDEGENGNSTLFVPTNALTVLLAGDDDAMTVLEKRLFIDKSSTPTRVYKITRMDDMLYNYHEQGSTLSLIAKRDLFNPDVDNQELGVCDYKEPILPPDYTEDGDIDVELHISHKGTNSIVAGGNAKTFTCYALTSDGQDAVLSAIVWTVSTTPENRNFIHYEVQPDPTKIKIRADYDESIIGSQILLTANVFHDTVSLYIEIGGGI